MSSEKFKAIWPLPGGATKHVNTLTWILKKIEEYTPTFDELLEWFKSEYKLSGEKAPKEYLELIRRLGFFRITDNKLSLTDASLKFFRE